MGMTAKQAVADAKTTSEATSAC
jgi:hypothetical protein